MTTDLTYHGGNLAAAEALFGKPAAGWLDLSTGINPFAYPNVDVDPALLHRLPTEREVDQLLLAASGYYGVPDEAHILAVAGSQAALQWLPRLREPGKVAVLSPTYSEHARTWRDADHSVEETGDPENLREADVAVICNPNNPDGKSLSPDEVLAIAEGCTDSGRWVVVDEAFADTMPGNSTVPHTGREGIIITRSFGKFFGLAGVRLGFVIGSHGLIDRLAEAVGPWAVGGAALEIGTRALSDKDWITETLAHLAAARASLDAVLRQSGFEIVGGTDLFRLVQHNEAQALVNYLGECGILVRPFADTPQLLRFGLPGNKENLARLKIALGDFSD
jgi:cobalamin biosynthetic protein CobC